MNRRPARHSTLSSWWMRMLRNEMGVGFGFAFGAALLALLITSLVIASDQTSTSREISLARYLHATTDQRDDMSEKTVALRKARASQILKLDEKAEVFLEPAMTDNMYDKLVETAATGQAPSLDLHVLTWRWLYWILAGWAILSLVVVMYEHAETCDYEQWFLTDLPWRMPWTWLLVLLTLVPFGFIAWPVSAIRFALWRKNHGTEAAEEVDPDPYYRGQMPRVDGEYYSSPNAALEWYRTTRGNGWKHRQLEAAQRAAENVELTERDLRSLSTQLRDRQQELGVAKARQRELEAAAADYQPDIAAKLVDEEFDTLLKLKGVAAVQVVNDRLVLILQATFTYKNTVYDLGDWELTFGFDWFRAQELRSGVRRSWRGGYPVYGLDGGGFCFGAREYIIRDHVRKGQFLEAAQVAVATIQNINEEDLNDVPKAFKEVDK